MSPHYVSLIFGYGTATGLWFLLNHFYPSLWGKNKRINFDKPYLEFIFSILAILAVIGIGQLYLRQLLIPNNANIFLDAINQVIIFSPVFILILTRKQTLETLWLPKSKIGIRLSIGLLLAFCSIFSYWLTRSDANGFLNILSGIYHYQNFSHFVQVFMEDVAIVLVFVRLSSWIGDKWSILIIATLFSAAHIPSLLTNGASLIELSSLIIDTSLGVLVLLALSKSRDIWWFFMVHFAMDMTQFYGGSIIK